MSKRDVNHPTERTDALARACSNRINGTRVANCSEDVHWAPSCSTGGHHANCTANKNNCCNYDEVEDDDDMDAAEDDDDDEGEDETWLPDANANNNRGSADGGRPARGYCLGASQPGELELESSRDSESETSTFVSEVESEALVGSRSVIQQQYVEPPPPPPPQRRAPQGRAQQCRLPQGRAPMEPLAGGLEQQPPPVYRRLPPGAMTEYPGNVRVQYADPRYQAGEREMVYRQGYCPPGREPNRVDNGAYSAERQRRNFAAASYPTATADVQQLVPRSYRYQEPEPYRGEVRPPRQRSQPVGAPAPPAYRLVEPRTVRDPRGMYSAYQAGGRVAGPSRVTSPVRVPGPARVSGPARAGPARATTPTKQATYPNRRRKAAVSQDDKKYPAAHSCAGAQYAKKYVRRAPLPVTKPRSRASGKRLRTVGVQTSASLAVRDFNNNASERNASPDQSLSDDTLDGDAVDEHANQPTLEQYVQLAMRGARQTQRFAGCKSNERLARRIGGRSKGSTRTKGRAMPSSLSSSSSKKRGGGGCGGSFPKTSVSIVVASPSGNIFIRPIL